jgi:hypothetical protein
MKYLQPNNKHAMVDPLTRAYNSPAIFSIWWLLARV